MKQCWCSHRPEKSISLKYKRFSGTGEFVLKKKQKTDKQKNWKIKQRKRNVNLKKNITLIATYSECFPLSPVGHISLTINQYFKDNINYYFNKLVIITKSLKAI